MLGTVRLLILSVNGLQGPRRLISWSWTNVSDGKSRNTVSSRDSLETLFYCLGLGLGATVLVLVLVSRATVMVLVSRVTVLVLVSRVTVLVLVSRGTVLVLIFVSRGTVLVTSLDLWK